MTTTGPSRGRRGGAGREPAGGNPTAMARGAGLIALAIIIGIVLLNIIDDGSGPIGDVASDDDQTTSTTAAPTTTTTAVAPPPESVHVLVLNAGGPGGSAGRMAEQLKAAGYTNQPVVPGNFDPDRDGNAALCKAGFEGAGPPLAVAVGQGTEVGPFPDPAPPDTEEIDCLVLVGRAVTTDTTAAPDAATTETTATTTG